MGVMIMCPHEFDRALCSIRIKNAALSFSLVGHPWPTTLTVFNIIIMTY